jgi:hypothetical protein
MNATINGCGGRVPPRRNRGPTQDLVVLLQPEDLGLQLPGLGQLLTGGARPLTAVGRGLAHPAAHGLVPEPLAAGHGMTRSGQRRVVGRWSRTRRVHRSLTFASSLFGIFASFLLTRMRHQTWDASSMLRERLGSGKGYARSPPHEEGVGGPSCRPARTVAPTRPDARHYGRTGIRRSWRRPHIAESLPV